MQTLNISLSFFFAHFNMLFRLDQRPVRWKEMKVAAVSRSNF